MFNFQQKQTPESLLPHKNEVISESLVLTPQEKETIKNITRGIDDIVAPEIIEMSLDDVITTLENKHPLNQIIKNEKGEIVGYVACEDFLPKEAYIKYLSTTGLEGRNVIQEINAFLESAKMHGYQKLNFHGWNNRLNNILKRFGFQRVRTDTMGGYGVDFYEKNLVDEKAEKSIDQKRIKAFEDKYIQKITKDYEHILSTYGQDVKKEKRNLVESIFTTVSNRLASELSDDFGNRQKAIFKLKLARYFQTNDTIDTATLIDAILESPKFIDTDKGSLHRLFEVHQEKTLIKIAEIRKRKAEQTGEEQNPYEALFETSSGKYYMARLINMPHLEEESSYMNHCVGTSDSYINKIKRGEVEILSFRNAPTINTKDNKLNDDDTPIITIEYNPKTKTILQMKKYDDAYLETSDPYFAEVVESLGTLRATENDKGEKRDFKKIAESELGNIEVTDEYVLTPYGEVHFREYNPDLHGFVLKKGALELGKHVSLEDKCKIVNISFATTYAQEQIAFKEQDITQETKIYIGPLVKSVLHNDTIEIIATDIDKDPILKEKTIIGGKSGPELEKLLTDKNFKLWGNAQDMLNSPEFEMSSRDTEISSVTLSVAQLGFPSGATYGQIMDKAKEYDLDVVPHDFAPMKRLTDDDPSWKIIHMKPISTGGGPGLLSLGSDGDGLGLSVDWGGPGSRWIADGRFVFSCPQTCLMGGR
jgi:hypothetical protein